MRLEGGLAASVTLRFRCFDADKNVLGASGEEACFEETEQGTANSELEKNGDLAIGLESAAAPVDSPVPTSSGTPCQS